MGVTSRRLAGTVTFVDWQGTDADEREYSEAVASRWRVRNEVVIDPPFWCDDDPPPHLDQPMDSLAFYPRDRRLCAIVRDAGGRVLLAGFGSDELFTGTTLFFADWLAQGRVWATARELARWATIGRVSFWRLAYGNALLPLVPARARHPRTYEQGRLLPWISSTVARRFELQARVFSLAGNSARRGDKYHSAIVTQIKAVATKLDAGIIGDTLDVRYPFLYRPLVEFALRLPPELCARPQARKWVLREAMRGILPETVRARIGKGAPTDVLVRSLTVQRDLLASLVAKPILAELGVIDATQLRVAFEAAPQGGYGDRDLCTDVQATLMAEAWLRIRSGRWPQGPS
jgi:asparagine synthase (glutamine-hydrolysing)